MTNNMSSSKSNFISSVQLHLSKPILNKSNAELQCMVLITMYITLSANTPFTPPPSHTQKRKIDKDLTRGPLTIYNWKIYFLLLSCVDDI